MLLIRNATVLTMTGTILRPGYVWIEPPLIRAVGAGEPPQELLAGYAGPVLDAEGGWLMPGMIDAHCHVGLFNDGLRDEGDDGNEMTDPVTPQLLAIDGIFQDDRCFSEALAYGVTTVMTGPGSANVLAGRFALMRTAGRTIESMAVNPSAAMKAAFGENPKRIYGHGKAKAPGTRMATASILRESLVKASHYRDEKKRQAALPNKGDTAAQETDLRWEALLPVLCGDQLLKIHAHRTDDILTAMRIANEFGLRYTLDHCTEGYLIADLLAHAWHEGQKPGHGCGQPGLGKLCGIIVGPLLSDRSKPELARSSIENPAILAATGIPVAIMTDHPVIPIQYLPVSAAIAVRAGMSEEHALAAITIQAARLCDAGDCLGSIEAGKQADLALFDGHPLDFRSRTRLVISQGLVAFSSEASQGGEA